jgi:hypothetical protein
MVVAPPTPLPPNVLVDRDDFTGDEGVEEEFFRDEPPRNHFGMIYTHSQRRFKGEERMVGVHDDFCRFGLRGEELLFGRGLSCLGVGGRGSVFAGTWLMEMVGQRNLLFVRLVS